MARILYAMGRDGVLPRKVFGLISQRFSTPVNAILSVAGVSVLANWISAPLSNRASASETRSFV